MGKKYGIQCKMYNGIVNNSAVQEAYTGSNYYSCDAAVVLTNSTFTKKAIDEARTLNVSLWSDNKIYISNNNCIQGKTSIDCETLSSNITFENFIRECNTYVERRDEQEL